LTLGDEKVDELNEIVQETGILRALTPTDCVKDRLSHYFHWGDRQCLAQAKLVAAHQKIDIESVRNWALREGKGAEFKAFLGDLQ